MELGVSHEQSLSSSTPVVDNTFDKYNKNLVPIRSLSDHDNNLVSISTPTSIPTQIYQYTNLSKKYCNLPTTTTTM